MTNVEHQCISLDNSDTTTNLNGVANTVVPWDTATPVMNEGDWTAGTNRIQTDFTGVIRLSCNLHTTSTGTRNSIGMRFRQNTVEIGPRCEGSYIRNNGGVDEFTLFLYYVVACTNGDDFDVVTIRHGSDTVATTMATAGTSSFIAERVR